MIMNADWIIDLGPGRRKRRGRGGVRGDAERPCEGGELSDRRPPSGGTRRYSLPSETVSDLVQIAGALGVLVPFVLLQQRRLDAASLPYLIPNLLGSGLLAVIAALDRNWGFLLLEAVWGAVAARGIFTNLFGASPDGPATMGSK